MIYERPGVAGISTPQGRCAEIGFESAAASIGCEGRPRGSALEGHIPLAHVSRASARHLEQRSIVQHRSPNSRPDRHGQEPPGGLLVKPEIKGGGVRIGEEMNRCPEIDALVH